MSAVLEQPVAKYGLPAEVRFCTRCVMSNQRPNSCVEHENNQWEKKQTIAFDSEGVCDACLVAQAKKSINWRERERELLDLLNRHRSRDGAYDCIVPGSGGKDSFYAAHVLKYRYGMHPLTVTWAPHLYTEWGWRNFQRWLAAGFDNILVTPNPKTHRLLARLALENLFHPFQPFVLGQKNLAPRLADEHGIKLVFYGESEAEYGNPRADASTATRDGRYHTGRDIYLGGVPVRDLRSDYRLTAADLAPYLPVARTSADVRYLGYYLPWHPQGCYYYAVEHGGFECAPERSPGTYSKYSSIDDKVDDWHYLCTFLKFGIGRATYDAAQEIRSGEITRDEGIALVKRFDGEYPKRFEKDFFEYVSVDGFAQMDERAFWKLADNFRSPHIWNQTESGQWVLRRAVWH